MNDSSPDLISDANIHQLLGETYLSYKELFRRLNKTQDGRIEVDQLIEFFDKIGVEISSKKHWAIGGVNFHYSHDQEL